VQETPRLVMADLKFTISTEKSSFRSFVFVMSRREFKIGSLVLCY